MKTLKILISVPLEKRNFERFDIDIYLNFFDKIQIYHIHEGINFKKDKIFNHKKIEIFKINNYLKLFQLLKIEKGPIYLDYTLPGLKSCIFKIVLYFKDFKKIISKIGHIPAPKIRKFNFNIKIKRIFNLISSKFFDLIEETFFTKKNIYLCAGKKIQNQYKDRFIINCHSYDLNEKLKLKKKSNIKKNYFLYLDQYEHNHPDYKYANQKMVNPKMFYKSLNSFFDKIEKKFKKKVIIAAHPRAKKHPYFKNRKVVSNKIIELSKNCFSSIAHSTTSISFSIIFRKPIIFILNNEMFRVDINKNQKISCFANELNFPVFNIDNNDFINDLSRYLKNINKKKYHQYYKNYISYNTNNNKKIGEIICQIFSFN